MSPDTTEMKVMFAHTLRNTFAAALLALSVVPSAAAFAAENGPSDRAATIQRDEREERRVWEERYESEHRAERREDREAIRRYEERKEAEWRMHLAEFRHDHCR